MLIKNLENLAPDVAKKIEIYCTEMMEIHQEELISIYAYGDTLEKKSLSPKSRLSLLFIFENITMDILNKSLSPVKKGINNNIVTPLFMTKNNIKTSTDVFPLEFLEIKNNNILLYGSDIMETIEIKTDNIRLQCEQEIKGKIIRLRQTYLEKGDQDKITEAMILDSFGALIPTFKGLVGLKGIKPLKTKEDTIENLCSSFDLNVQIFKDILNDNSRDSKIGNKKANIFLADYIQELTKLAITVDKMDK